MHNKLYDADVRDFINQQNGIFLVLSADQVFNKNLRATVSRYLLLKDECIHNVISPDKLQREVKLLRSQSKKILLFTERDWNSLPLNDLITYLKNDYPDLMIVTLTSEVEREKLILLHEIGVDNIITKPISPDTLIEKIAFTVKPRGQIGEMIDEGKQCLELQDFAGAEKLAMQILEIKQNSPAGLILLGDAQKGQGKFDAALKSYQEASNSARLYLEPLKRIALLHKETGNLTEELKQLEKLDKLSPLNIDRKVNIGQNYLQLGDKDKASAVFDSALKLATKEALASVGRVVRSIAESCLGEAPELSEKYLRQSLESKKGLLDKSDIELYNRLGITLRKQGKWKESIDEYRKAIKIAPNDSGLYYNLAMAHSEGKLYGDAVNYLKKALTVNPDLYKASETVCINFATIFLKAGKKDEAIEYMKKAMEINPGSRKAAEFLRELTN